MEEVFVLSGVRTPIGKYGGGLSSVPPCDLAAKVVREAVSRSGVEPDQFGHSVFGNVIHTEVRDMYLSRVAAVDGGLPVGMPALTVNRLCGSGLQAIVSASQAIMLGDCDVAVAGGAECMSRSPYWLPGMRWGQRMGDGTALDPMVGALSDPWDGCHMGVTAENVATDFHVSRADQDALAAESHRRAAAATAAGYFKEQILPVEIPGKRGSTTVVDTDEHIRPGVSLEDMAKLKPAFAKDGRSPRATRPASTTPPPPWYSPRGVRQPQRPDADGPAGRLQPRRGRTADHGHGPGARPSQGAGAGRPQGRRHRLFEVNEASRHRRWPWPANWGCRRSGPTPTAAASPWATRSARPAPSSPSRRCTNCAAPAAATGWSPCA